MDANVSAAHFARAVETDFAAMFSTKIWVSLILPFLFVLAGGIVKKNSRGTKLRISDFYFGLELCFAAITSSTFYALDLASAHSGTPATAPSNSETVTKAFVFILVACFVFLVLMGIHQDHASDTEGREKPLSLQQFFWLFIVSNGVGVGMLLGFLFKVKGV